MLAVNESDLFYIYEEVSAVRQALLVDTSLGRDVPDPYKLDGPLETLREILGVSEEDEDGEAEQGSLELNFNE